MRSSVRGFTRNNPIAQAPCEHRDRSKHTQRLGAPARYERVERVWIAQDLVNTKYGRSGEKGEDYQTPAANARATHRKPDPSRVRDEQTGKGAE